MSLDAPTLQKAFEKIKSICDGSDGRSQLFPFGGSGYHASVTHFFESSTEIAAFAVQPGSEKDLQSIVKAIAETGVAFAIKCGGHATNPGFSSTKGVQIYLTRFNKIDVDTDKRFVDVGAGCLFGEIYRELARYKHNIVGGEGLAGIGVSGWLLGGGYSVKTSQYGLGIDHIESVRLVLPDGSLKHVSATENKDLFFAIKGGGNNFGIVTEFRLRLHPQEHYYSFELGYQEKVFAAANLAIIKFCKQTDNKANLRATFRIHNTPDGIQKSLAVGCVYDGVWPTVNNPFAELMKIEHTFDNFGEDIPGHGGFPAVVQANEPVTTHPTNSFYLADTLRSLKDGTYSLGDLPQDLVGQVTSQPQFNILMCRLASYIDVGIRSGQLLPITEFVGDGSLRSPSSSVESKLKSLEPSPWPMKGIGEFPRGRWGVVMVDDHTPEIIAAAEEEFNKLVDDLKAHKHKWRRIELGLRPETRDMFEKATESAWPHRKDEPNMPIIFFLIWEGKDDDRFFVHALGSTLERLRERIAAISLQSKDLPHFISASLAETTTPSELYRGNLERLRQIKKVYDPSGVMCQTGGFKIHHTTNEAGACGCNRRAS